MPDSVTAAAPAPNAPNEQPSSAPRPKPRLRLKNRNPYNVVSTIHVLLFGVFLLAQMGVIVFFELEFLEGVYTERQLDLQVLPAGHEAGPVETEQYSRTTLHFSSKNETLEGWLYMPANASSSQQSCVIMAHGLTCLKDFQLDEPAAFLASAGYSVLVFDYRHFGGSTGQPRHLVSTSRQLEDWEAAVREVQAGLGGRLSCAKVSLWGTSLSGGHAVVTAAKFGDSISAVVAQTPHLNGLAGLKDKIKQRGVFTHAQLLLLALHDQLRVLAELPPTYLRTFGGPKQLAFLQLDAPDMEAWEDTVCKRCERQGGWKNALTARALLQLPFYNPAKSLPQVKAPVQFLACADDALYPAATIQAAAAAHQQVQPATELLALPCRHFDVYHGVWLARAVTEQLAFLDKHARA